MNQAFTEVNKSIQQVSIKITCMSPYYYHPSLTFFAWIKGIINISYSLKSPANLLLQLLKCFIRFLLINIFMSSMQCSKVNQISVQDNEPVGTLSPANHKKIWKIYLLVTSTHFSKMELKPKRYCNIHAMKFKWNHKQYWTAFKKIT